MADHHDGAAPMGASDHRVFDMTSAALWRGGIHDLVVEGLPRLARQWGHHDASDTAMVAPGELVETDVQAGIREQVVNDCHGLNVARCDTRSILTSARGVFGEEPFDGGVG